MGTARSDLAERLEDVLAGHPVAFAMLFGSAAHGDGSERGDVDLAVEFADEVVDAGISDAYLALTTDLEDSLGEDVDVVTFRSMSPQLRSVVFEEGIPVVGTEADRAEIARRFRQVSPSVDEAKARVATSASRLAEDET